MRRRKGFATKTLGSMARTSTRKARNSATQALYMAMWGEEAPSRYKKSGRWQICFANLYLEIFRSWNLKDRISNLKILLEIFWMSKSKISNFFKKNPKMVPPYPECSVEKRNSSARQQSTSAAFLYLW